MKKNLIIFFIVLLFLVFLQAAAVDLMDRTSGVSFLGAGGTGVARADNLYAPYWNPAGLALVREDSMGFNYYSRLEEVNHISIDSVFNVKNKYNIGLNFVQEEISDIPKTVDAGGEGQKVGSFADTYRMFNASTATKLRPGVYFGGNFKFLTRDIDDYQAFGYGLDLGLLKRVDRNSNVGIAFKNIISKISWTTLTEEELERKLVFGISNFNTTATQQKYIINFDYEISVANFNDQLWALGGEYWFSPNQFALRAGINGNRDLSIGFGLCYMDFKADFAYIIKEEYFEDMFLFSVGFDLRYKNLSDNRVSEISDSDEENITDDQLQVDYNFLKDVKVTTENINIILGDISSLKKIAIVDVKKDVNYFSPQKLTTNNITIENKGEGEYVIFFQHQSGEILKQRLKI